ncbi:MAG: hypothetical protein ACPLYX_11135 [Rectinema subterraneum]|uniref:PAB0415 family putative ATP pyrophosphatase n=1 Tax=Rectinema subterraneum TaxID=2653714 RepID=UPI003C7ED3EB
MMGTTQKGLAFYSGGKDGLYAAFLARKMGIQLDDFLLLNTTIGVSPHLENRSCLEAGIAAMGARLLEFDMKNGAAALAAFLADNAFEVLVSGDVYLDDHRVWLENLAKSAGIQLQEPLWKRDSYELACAMLADGFHFMIVAVDREKLDKKWLGYTFMTQKDLDHFCAENPTADPVGEQGEFHTLVFNCPLFSSSLLFHIDDKVESDRYWYAKLSARVCPGNLNSKYSMSE